MMLKSPKGGALYFCNNSIIRSVWLRYSSHTFISVPQRKSRFEKNTDLHIVQMLMGMATVAAILLLKTVLFLHYGKNLLFLINIGESMH